MIIKIKEKIFDPYARIPNRILGDSSISWKAKGILAYCMSKPENWEIRITDLIRKSTDGESAIRSAIKELQQIGYCQGIQIKNEKGEIAGYQYNFADYPYWAKENAQEPHVENPHVENPHVDNPHVDNRHNNKTKESKTENNNKLLLDDTSASYDGRPQNVPFGEIVAIFEKMRPHKKFIRRKSYGVTEKGIAKFWRENDKITQCFYDLIDRLEESDYLMGTNGHSPPVQIKDPDWSWIFKQGNDGRLNAFGIIEGKYANDRMAFALEKAKKEAEEEVFIVGFNEKRKVDLSDPKFQVVGFDEVLGIKKVVEVG
jgi:hypothetical protein